MHLYHFCVIEGHLMAVLDCLITHLSSTLDYPPKTNLFWQTFLNSSCYLGILEPD